MKQIQEIEHISDHNKNLFTYKLAARINHQQRLGHEIDIQYSVATLGGEIMYTALLIGRK